MSVMHPAVSHNYESMGYYPTDERTLSCLVDSIALTDEENLTLLDPCCGEGTAMNYLHQRICPRAKTVGVELELFRYHQAMQSIDHCVNADALVQVKYKRACIGALFLNPPYGESSFSERLEMVFMQRYIGALAKGGLLMLVIPHYIVTLKIATYLCQHFEDLCFGISPEQKYRQMVIIGRKIRRTDSDNIAARVASIMDAVEKKKPFVCPDEAFKLVPDMAKFELYSSNMSEDLVGEVVSLSQGATLWPSFKRDFVQVTRANRNPLMPLSDWHTAQTILAGMVSGLIESDQRRMLIKGTVSKVLLDRYEDENDEDSEDQEIDNNDTEDSDEYHKTVQVETFEPVIIGIDVTIGSQHFGELYEIR